MLIGQPHLISEFLDPNPGFQSIQNVGDSGDESSSHTPDNKMRNSDWFLAPVCSPGPGLTASKT